MSDTSLSGVGGAPAAEHDITSTLWALRVASLSQRRELIAYAVQKGVPLLNDYRPHELDLGWYEGELVVYSGLEPEAGWTTPAQFKAMCDAYAAC